MAFDTIAAAVSAITKRPPVIAGFSIARSTMRATTPSPAASASTLTATRRLLLPCTFQLLVPDSRRAPRGAERKPDGCGSALAQRAVDQQFAAVKRGETLHHGEAEPGPPVAAIVARIGLDEGPAELRQVLRRNPDAGVGDEERDAVLLAPRPDNHAPAAFGELHSVRQEVE